MNCATFTSSTSPRADAIPRPELELAARFAAQCPLPMLVLDETMAPAAANDAFQAHYGPDAGLEVLAGPADLPRRLTEQGRWQGTTPTAQVTAWAVKGPDGRVAGYVVQADVLAGEQARARNRAGRLEASRRAIRALAHDFNGALAGVAACVEMGLDMLPPGQDEVRFELDEAFRACAGARETLKAVLALGRDSGLEKTSQSLALAVRRALGDVDAADRPAEVELDLAAWPDTVLAHPDLLDRIVGALLRNARLALRDADRPPRLRLRLAAAPAPASLAGTAAASWLRLDVEDNGPGLAPELLERVFDPYFSTRTREEGRGLGLTAAWAAAWELGGDLDVRSAPGRGACFSLWLPLAEAAGSIADPVREE